MLTFLFPPLLNAPQQKATNRLFSCARRSGFLGKSVVGSRSHLHTTNTEIQACSDAASGSAADDVPIPVDIEHEELVKKLEAKELKWVDIPFSSIHEELEAIDDYERQEEVSENDPWPKFLRGAAYEYWGQPQLALAQYAKTANAGGLRQIPQLWERRAYNAFKLGKVAAANSYYDVALALFYESCGNPLHIVHWFEENFRGYIPKWNGPAAPIQRGICKYCMGMPKEARESFMAQVASQQKEMDHAMLWFIASTVKSSSDGVLSSADEKVITDAFESDFEWDKRLSLFFKLYYAAARGVGDEVTAAENELSDAIKVDDGDDISTNLYLALYHDAFTNDSEERDRVLNLVAAVGSPPSTRDTENFLFHAAKHRLSIPKGGESPDIPESRPM